MKTVKTLALTAAVATALTGCSVVDSYNEIDTLNKTQAVGSPFTQALAAEYRDYSNSQFSDHFDYPDSLHFARKGLAAAAGEAVLPEAVSDWGLNAQHIQELSAARSRIILAYDRSARETAPNLSAKVQAKFDCWTEFQEEEWDNNDLGCKNEFFSLLNELEATLPPPQVAAPIAAPAPAFGSEVFNIDPSEPLAIENAVYLIFFNWDSAKVGSGALSILDAVRDEANKTSPSTINLVGHADTSGAQDYNERLALKRVKATKSKLVERGIDPSIIYTDAKGESDLLVPTPDNVREPANRRVNISFE